MFKSSNAIYISLAAAAVFALGVAGLSTGDCALAGWQDRIVETFKLFLHAGTASSCTPSWPLATARYAAPYVVPFVALFATIKLALANLRHDVRVAGARYKRRHILVCGLGDTGMQIVENLRKTGDEVVAIDLDDGTPHAATAGRWSVPVLKGDAADPSVLHFAGLLRTRAVIICTGEDAGNVDIALRIQETAKKRSPRYGTLSVLVEMRHEWLFAKLIDHDKEPLGSDKVEIRPFNVYQNAARTLVRSVVPQPALDGPAKRVAIVGFGSMGKEVTRHLLRAAPVPLGAPVRILVLDRAGEELGRSFLAGLPVLEPFAELSFVTAEFGAESADKSSIIDAALDGEAPLAAVVCLPDDQVSLYVALGLRGRFDRQGHFDAPIFVRLQRHHRLGEFAAHIERLPRLDERLRVFGSLEELLSPDVLIGSRLDGLAQALHQHYVAGLPAERRTALNARPWHELPEHFKMSSRREADHIRVKFAQAGFSLGPGAASEPLELTDGEIDVLARLEHRRWTIERRLRGWTYGPVRDDLQHLNPYLVAWEDLPAALRDANRASIAALPPMLARAGLELQRKSATGDEAQPGNPKGR